MGSPPASVVLVIALGLAVSTVIHAEESSGPRPDATQRDITREGHGSQCTSLQSRQDLLDSRLTTRDTRLDEVDTRLNRIDNRLDGIETVITDLKEYLRQRMDAMEIKAEWGLTGTKHKGKKTVEDSKDYRPLRTPQVHKGCQEAYKLGWTSSGLYRIAPEPTTHIDVYCEQGLDGGGWAVFQVRKDGSVNFYENWNSYKTGFGNLTSEFWLGNDNIHLMTKHGDQELKIELMSEEGEVKYVDYSHFSIADEPAKYRVNITGFTGESPPGNSFGGVNGQRFSTKDQDNDTHPKSCANIYMGGWWYSSCHASNLNGRYGSEEYGKGVVWYHWKGDHKSMKATRMMIRKRL